MSQDEHAAARPATFSEVFASGEYRAVFSASVLSWVGDYIAKAAVTAMVYRQTGSVTLSAATFAISYLPWLIGGPLLAALAERYPNRTVMVAADLVRATLILLVAVPHMPVPVILLLLFLTALFNPPFDAARSALLPRILTGDRYVVAIALQGSAGQAAMIVGYMSGGTLAAFSPQIALAIDAATFAFSAFVIGLGVSTRPPGLLVAERTHLLRETAAGFRVVFGNAVLRAIAVLVFAASLFAVVPEGLAAAWAGHLSADPHEQGWMQGLIMVGNAVGFATGGLVFSRLLAPATRRRLIPAFAVLVPLALTPALFDPPAAGVAAIGFLSGLSIAGMIPAANGLFVQALPNAFRARAFGIMQSGVQILQGLAVLFTGALATRAQIPLVVGLWCSGGVLVMLIAGLALPGRERFDAAIEDARMANELAEAARATGAPGPTAPAATGRMAAPGGTVPSAAGTLADGPGTTLEAPVTVAATDPAPTRPGGTLPGARAGEHAGFAADRVGDAALGTTAAGAAQ